MVMDVQEIISPADLGAVLDQFKAFAVARGWVLDGDSGGVFQLRSTGYGNQNMIFRFLGQYTTTYAYYGLMTVIGISPLTPAFSTSMTAGAFTSTGTYQQISIRGAGAHKAWIIGNSKFLAIAQMNNEYSMSSFAVGSFELFNESREDGFFVTLPKGTSGVFSWDTTVSAYYNSHLIPGTQFYGVGSTFAWLYGAGRSDTNIRSNFYYYNIGGYGGFFDSLSDFIINGMSMPYSGSRVLVKPTAYGLDSSFSLWRPIGKWPWYVLKFAGLTPGRTIDFGGDTYMVFPSMYIPHPYGWAVRIS